MVRLEHFQFCELAHDVADEAIRRTPGPKSHPNPPLIPHLHHKRNEARERLTLLSWARFRDLAGEVLEELLRRFPRLEKTAGVTKGRFTRGEAFRKESYDWRGKGRRDMVMIEQVKALQVGGEKGKDEELIHHLREYQKYVVPLVYETVEEVGLVNVELVRVRLVIGGPWIEVRIQREEEKVSVVSFLPDTVMTERKRNSRRGRLGVYALYKCDRRMRVTVGWLEYLEGKWRLAEY